MRERFPGKALRLYPLPAVEIEPTAIHNDLPIIPPSERATLPRPYTFINMVTSADGQATMEGKTSKIGSDVDRHTMRNLRANSDAVMVGANTLRAERLSLGLGGVSQGGQPLGVILTTTGDVPLETNLIFHESQTVLAVASGEIPEDRIEALSKKAKVLRISTSDVGHSDLSATLEALKRDHGVERLLVEGGPTLNHALISAGLVDELFLTLAPKLLGSDTTQDARTIVSGTLPATVGLRLVSAHLAADELFLRYAVANDTGLVSDS